MLWYQILSYKTLPFTMTSLHILWPLLQIFLSIVSCQLCNLTETIVHLFPICLLTFILMLLLIVNEICDAFDIFSHFMPNCIDPGVITQYCSSFGYFDKVVIISVVYCIYFALFFRWFKWPFFQICFVISSDQKATFASYSTVQGVFKNDNGWWC